VAAPCPATRRAEKPARPVRKFILNRHRRTNRTRARHVSLELHEFGMSHNAVGDVDSEVVAGIANAPLLQEEEILGTIIGESRTCDG
jgi:hypothetical protein